MGRRKTVLNDVELTKQQTSKKAVLGERTTPARKLDFGHETRAFSDVFSAQKYCEKNITEFLASYSHESQHYDPLIDLKLDKSQDVGEKKSQDDMRLKTFSALEGAVSLADDQQELLLLVDGANNKKTQEHCNDSLFLGKPHSALCSSGVILEEEEEEEQVLIGRDVVYPSTRNTILSESEDVSLPLGRQTSTPCFFSTQDGNSCRNQESFLPTSESMPTLTLQDIPQKQNGNFASIRNFNGYTQMVTEAIATTGGNAFSETIEGKVIKGALDSVQLTETFSHSLKKNVTKSCRAVGGEEKKKTIFANRSIPQSTEDCNNNEVEEDAPFFQNLLSVQLPSLSKGRVSRKSHKRPYYTVGMRVEGRWGARWFGAAVTEEEKNGYVQVRWDEDGSLIHLKVQEVRLPQKKKKVCSEDIEKAQPMSPVMTASQLVDLVNNETPVRPMGKKETRENMSNQETDSLVDISTVSLFITSAAQNYSINTRLNIDKLVKHGALVVLDSFLELDKSQLAKSKEKQQGIFLFIITEDNAKENGGVIVSMAHAMGVSAVSVKWLDRLEIDDVKECQGLCFPMVEDLLGQCNDTSVRWRWLSKNERFLNNKRIYLKDYDADIAFLLTLCGGTVTQETSSDAVLPPHYVYVASVTNAQIPPNFKSAILMEKSWLFSQINEFFNSLPQLQQNRDKSVAFHQPYLAGSIFKNKRYKKEEEGKMEKGDDDSKEYSLRENTFVLSPQPIAGYGGAAADCDVPEVLVGEDYYFRVKQVENNTNEAPLVKLGRVIHFIDNFLVLMRLYEVKYTLMRHNPWTGSLENQNSVYLGPHTAQVFVKDLIFDIPVYVIEASQMQHVYTLESPPRDIVLDGNCGEGNNNEGKGC